jgi:hypothetical protein
MQFAPASTGVGLMQSRGEPRSGAPYRNPSEINMTKTAPTFESRLVPQSRECEDLNGTVSYEHNSYLEVGEKVVGAHSDIEMTVVKSRYRNPLTRQELVTVAVPRKGGGEEWIELAASAVRRVDKKRR